MGLLRASDPMELKDMYDRYWRWVAIGDQVRRQYQERFSDHEIDMMIRQAREQYLIQHQELCFEDDFYAWLGEEDQQHYCIDQTREQLFHGAAQTQVEQGILMESVRLHRLWDEIDEFVGQQLHHCSDDALDRLARLEYLAEHIKQTLSDAKTFHEYENRRRWASSNWKGPTQ